MQIPHFVRLPARFEHPRLYCCCEECSSCFQHLTATFDLIPPILQAQRRWLPRNVDACSIRLRRCSKFTLGLFSGCWILLSKIIWDVFSNRLGICWGTPFTAAQAPTKLALAESRARPPLQFRPAVSPAKMRWGVSHHSLNEVELLQWPTCSLCKSLWFA